MDKIIKGDWPSGGVPLGSGGFEVEVLLEVEEAGRMRSSWWKWTFLGGGCSGSWDKMVGGRVPSRRGVF